MASTVAAAIPAAPGPTMITTTSSATDGAKNLSPSTFCPVQRSRNQPCPPPPLVFSDPLRLFAHALSRCILNPCTTPHNKRAGKSDPGDDQTAPSACIYSAQLACCSYGHSGCTTAPSLECTCSLWHRVDHQHGGSGPNRQAEFNIEWRGRREWEWE